MIEIDINCDVGEGVGNEAKILPYISSCNIACGGHAGDAVTIREVIRIAKAHNVKVGAHPSYPDPKNFGRQVLDIASDILIASIRAQLALFKSVVESEKCEWHHIKPHGALYNEITKNSKLATIFLDAIKAYKTIPLYVPYTSKVHEAAIKRGVSVKLEAFGDRNYTADLQLVSRKESNALIEQPKKVLEHIVLMAKDQMVKTVEGDLVKIKADTYCIHGDTSTALEILMYLEKQLTNHNIQIKK